MLIIAHNSIFVHIFLQKSRYVKFCMPCKRNNPPVCYADMPPLHKGAYETLSLPSAGVAMATPREAGFA